MLFFYEAENECMVRRLSAFKTKFKATKIMPSIAKVVEN
jgi:hypothetical protein